MLGKATSDRTAEVIQSVSAWKEAFPTQALVERLVNAKFDAEDANETILRLTEGLNSNRNKNPRIRAYLRYENVMPKRQLASTAGA